MAGYIVGRLSVDNLVPSIACELQVKLYGRDISIQFEITNKKTAVYLYKNNHF